MESDASETVERRTFWDHVGVLRSYILIGGGIFIACAFALFGRGTDIMVHVLLAPLHGKQLVFLSPMGPFLFEVRLAFLGATAICFPLWLYLCARFVGEALPTRKRRRFFLFVLAAAVMGFAALAASSFLLVPVSYDAFASFTVPGTTLLLSADSYVDFFFLVTVVCFAVVELPVLIVALAYVRLVSPHFLAKHRRYLYVALLILLGLITPTADPITLLAVTVPALLLAELGIALGKIVYTI